MAPDDTGGCWGKDMFDTMVFTKALGALCGALLIFLLGQWLANTLFVPGSRDLPPAFVLGLPDPDAVEEEVADAPPPEELSIGEAFQMADASAGERVWGQCRACHVADDTRNSVGPYLYNVVGRDIGVVDGFRYSGALPEDERWTIENLYAYLENPRGWAPGTSMSFAGLRNQMDRVNVIAFLIDNSPDFDTAEIPEPEEAAVEEEAIEEDAVEEEAVDEAAVEDEAVEEEAVAEEVVEEAVEEDAVAAAPVDEAVEDDAVAEAVTEDAIEEEDVALAEEAVTEEAVEDAIAEEAVEEDAVEEAAVPEAVDEAVEEEAVEDDAVTEAPAEEMTEIAAMVADGDAGAGARVWNQCRACHIADAEQNRVGPHLVGIIGRQSNQVPGFRYSGNLPDVVWTLDELYEYIENPRGYAPGTSMVFAGLRSQDDRINLLAYLQSLE